MRKQASSLRNKIDGDACDMAMRYVDRQRASCSENQFIEHQRGLFNLCHESIRS
ncbi:hypothetical protein D9M72_447030 [compost metagenome]